MSKDALTRTGYIEQFDQAMKRLLPVLIFPPLGICSDCMQNSPYPQPVKAWGFLWLQQTGFQYWRTTALLQTIDFAAFNVPAVNRHNQVTSLARLLQRICVTGNLGMRVAVDA